MTPEGEQTRPTSSELAAGDFERWRAGDADAQQRLVRRATPMLWHVVRAYGLSREQAEDVVQATWLALVRSAESVRDPGAVLGWLCVTARREALQVARTSRRLEPVEPDAIVRSLARSSGPEPDLADDVVASVDARVLWRAAAKLPPRCQRLLRVIAFEDRTGYRSLSAELGMPIGGIGPTRRRCLDKLRMLLADDPEWSGE